MSQTIEGNTTEERVEWAIRRLENLGNTIRDCTKHDIITVLREAKDEIQKNVPVPTKS